MASLDLLILQKLEIQQNWNSPHGISRFADSTKLEIQQNWNSPHGISGFAVLQKQKISNTGTSQHSIRGVAILVDQHIDKNCLIMSNSIASKIPEERINNPKGYSSVNSEIQQNTHCLLTVSRISNTIFQKVRMAAFVHSFLSHHRIQLLLLSSLKIASCYISVSYIGTSQ